MYKTLGILLLLSGLIAGVRWFADYCGDAREAEVRLEFATEKAILVDVRERLRKKADANRIKREIVYRDVVKTIYQSPDTTLKLPLPDELLASFCKIGRANENLCRSETAR
jgi:molybdopterin converting factor small subunit